MNGIDFHFDESADDDELVSALLKISSGLNDWELSFVEDVAHQVQEQGRRLTDRQRSKAVEIATEHGV